MNHKWPTSVVFNEHHYFIVVLVAVTSLNAGGVPVAHRHTSSKELDALPYQVLEVMLAVTGLALASDAIRVPEPPKVEHVRLFSHVLKSIGNPGDQILRDAVTFKDGLLAQT